MAADVSVDFDIPGPLSGIPMKSVAQHGVFTRYPIHSAGGSLAVSDPKIKHVLFICETNENCMCSLLMNTSIFVDANHFSKHKNPP